MNIQQHDQSLGYLTGLASRLFNRLLTSRFKQAGIDMTAEQWGVILTVRNSVTALSQKQIGEILYLEKSSVSRSINGLVQHGWLRCDFSPEDGRKKLVYLTDQAHEIADQCAEIAKTVLQDAQVGLTTANLSQCSRELQHVIQNLRILISPYANDE